MADIEVVDQIVGQTRVWNANPLPFLAMLHWESGGLSRTIEFIGDDGRLTRTFKGGDYGLRLNGEMGVRSYGGCQIYADVHGPFTNQVTTVQIGRFPAGSRIPDYRAAAAKWDDIIVSMQYLAVHGPNGGWLNVYNRVPFDYDVDPIQYMMWFAPRAQGSDPWAAWMAQQSIDAAKQLYADYLVRHPVKPTPPQVDWMEIVNGITYSIEGLSRTRDHMTDVRDEISAHIDGLKNLVESARV